MSYLTIESLNCRGLRDLKKRIDILDGFRKRNVNIIHLQETHLIASDLIELKKFWNCKYIISGKKRQSLGVMTIINNNFEYKINSVSKDSEGRYILCDIELPNIARFLMINIYGHNQDNPIFFHTIFGKLEQNNIKNWVVCGDWNLVNDQQLDTLNYVNQNNPNSSRYVKTFILKYNLVDIWRKCNPKSKNYLWFKKNPAKAARLDFFLITPTLLNIFADTYISFKYRSDHCKIGLKFHLDRSPKGKGIWKLNSELLNNITLMEKIKEGILLIVQVHACTPYHPDYVKTFDKNEISFMTTIDIIWEVLLSHLRGIFIAFAAKRNRDMLNEEKKLVKDIEKLDDLFILDMSDKDLEQELNDKKRDLEEI